MNIRMARETDFAQWLPLCWTTGDYMYLQDQFVDPDVRGKGVGRALIEHVYARAGAAGASRVWWLTHESNAQGMLLYDRVADKSGFVWTSHGAANVEIVDYH